MSELQNFPIKNQLASSDINKFFDCVPTSIASCLQYLTGKPFDGATIKDAVYTPGYQGPTDPARYVAYCQQHGVRMYSVNGSNAQLISIIQQQLALGHPLLLTENDPYVSASLGFTHVVAAFRCDFESIQAMDPYVGQAVNKSNVQWEQDLRYNQVWVLERVEEKVMLSIQQASEFFTETQKDEVWHCKQTDFNVSHGILQYYRACTNNDLNGLSIFGLPLSNEIAIPGYTGCTIQRFERANIIFDADHHIDKVPGIEGPCYPSHIDKGPGRDPAIAQLLSENSQLVSKVADLEQQITLLKMTPTVSTEKQ